MKKIVQSLLMLSMVILSLQFCQSPNETANSEIVNPPIKGIDVTFSTFEVEASEGKTIQLENGTSIVIPQNAFIDANGNPVSGKVFLKYREFHNAAEIIASGITMRYDSAGITNHFETAGMFEVKGVQKRPDQAQLVASQNNNEEPVFIAEGKSIEVNMGSFEGDNNYNFYYLDNNTRNWEYKGYSKAEQNAEKLAFLDEIAPVPAKPIEPKKATSDMQVFDLQLDSKEYPDFNSLQGVMWQYVGSKENSPYTENNKWIFQSNWKDVSINPSDEKEGQYTISFTANNQLVNLEAEPVFSGAKNQKRALKKFQKKMIAYEEAIQKRHEEEDRKKAEANLIRSFSINNFGIYNHDRLWNTKGVMQFAASFKAGDEVIKDAKIFLVTGNGKSLVEYKNYEWKNFRFDPKDTNRLLAVLSGNKVATFSSEQFKEVEFWENKSSYTFEMTVEDDITSLEDVSEILATL